MNNILYCHAKDDTTLTAGHWFYHLGQDAQCAQAYEENNKWTLYIDFEKYNKPLSEDFYSFNSLDECKKFVSDYFECAVEEVNPEDFPKPD